MTTNSKSIGDHPRYAPIPKSCEILGFGRSKLYELAGEGLIRVIKVGGRTLVDIDHALAWMETLPKANISPVYKHSRK